MAYEFRMERRVEFPDTDMAGIVHFSNFFKWMEAAEHAFFRSLGLKVHPHLEDGVWGWARVDASCSWSGPLRYDDVFEMHLLVREKKRRSFGYLVVFRKRGDGAEPDWQEVARGSLTTVCVARRAGQAGIRSIDMPDDVSERIEVAPASDLD